MNGDKYATSHLRPSIAVILPAVVVLVGLGACLGAPAWAGTLSGPLQAYAASPQGANRTVVVEVWLDPAQPASRAGLSLAGAQIQFASPLRVQCKISGDKLAALAAVPGVALVTQPDTLAGPKLTPGQFSALRMSGLGLHGSARGRVGVQQAIGFGPIVSEGVQLTNAAAYQTNGIYGSGATIAIIAYGFASAAADTAEIGTPATISFRADGTMGSDDTGTATAEVAADMAPQAAFTLIAVDTDLSLRQAINYVATNHFTAAICTVGSVAGPFDGTDMLSQALVNVAAAGTFWVQAAGDLAQRHWSGNFVNNGNNFCEINGGAGIDYNIAGPMEFRAFLSWFESAGATTAQNYDLQLYNGTTLVADSGVAHNGSTPPTDMLDVQLAAAGTYELRIAAISIDATKVDKFQLYTPDLDMPTGVAVPTSSLMEPAMSPNAFTVGATAGTTNIPTGSTAAAPAIDTIESFSSQGPTIGGALEPDLVGPDRVTTSLAAFTPFLSTAAGAAHVGGAAALLYAEDHTRTPADMARIMEMLAVPLPAAASSPNDLYGHGRLNLRVGLDTEPPTISIFYPQNSTTISTRAPLIQAKITDTGTGVKAASIVLTIDGKVITGFVYNPTTGLFSYMVTKPLSLTSHQITLTATDNAGNVATPAVVNFRVALPTLDAGIHLFSLPYTFAAGAFPTPNTLFGLSSGVQVARWLPADSQYHMYPDTYASFDPPDAIGPGAVVAQPPAGLGYFVNLPQAVTLNVSGLPLANSISEYDLNLLLGTRAPEGWNMIGCPFLSPIDFGSVEFVTNGTTQTLSEAVASGVTDGVLFAFQSTASGGYYTFPPDPSSAVIEPFQGYWLHVLQNTTMVMYPPVVASQVKPSPQPPQQDGWRLQLVAAANNSLEPCNFIGESSKATSAYSPRFAVGKPPSVDPSLSAALVEKNWGAHSGYFAQVIKPASGPQQWDLEVTCTQPNTEVSLRWPELNATVPAGVTLLLQDLDTGDEVYMRTSAGYTFRTGAAGGTRRLRITVSSDPASGLSLSGVTAQGVAGGAVAFTYALSQPAEVSAEIRNIAGTLIKHLGTQAVTDSSVQLLMWNGYSDRGSKVPPGRYLVRLTARTDQGQTMQAIRPFDVIP